MILISRNVLRYMSVPECAVIRINLAWEFSLKQLEEDIECIHHDVWIDVPRDRTKPPHNKYAKHEILRIVGEYANVKYLAVSNVDYPEDMMDYVVKAPRGVAVVPKIESVIGAQNINVIVPVLRNPKVVMIDHEDMFRDMEHKDMNASNLYIKYVNPVIEACLRMGAMPLTTCGIMFCSRDGIIRT